MTYLGLDVGGTHTRAVLHDAAGRELARATATGGNPAARGAPAALAVLAEVVARTVADPGAVRGCLLGLSGVSALADPDGFAEACRAAFGLTVPVRLVSDAVVAFAAGAPAAPGGTVLIAGTGAIACRIAGTAVTERAGGLGWLLGDEGGGFWLGREALRHAHAHAHDHPADPLGRAVLDACAAPDPAALLRWAYDGPPHRLASLAPLITELALTGDPAALRITESAAAHLAALVAALHRDDAPIVLAGSVATAPGPVHDGLLARLRAAHPAAPLTVAGDGAAAAARLAAAAG
ncbi:N-acetylglucosamine kinase [Kitasatospora viridis]|uniref:N-acetylglucosamine kinase-like BadF-type ATPase n=1 Tax=Kitasatospora viridis TaxID=281105 RepID=A0A561UBT7_9ACTN|nr:BadF/BadG/BcrA/BcrD ATPase family protein [Kitasatospora viridis]TWF96821.1 N-acetylglucosamine kinase-like BadF-type ATPase [Kitasatospora viridis]